MSLHDTARCHLGCILLNMPAYIVVDRWAKKDNFQFEPDQPIVVKEIQHPLLQAR